MIARMLFALVRRVARAWLFDDASGCTGCRWTLGVRFDWPLPDCGLEVESVDDVFGKRLVVTLRRLGEYDRAKTVWID